jgi:hypothetical protein
MKRGAWREDSDRPGADRLVVRTGVATDLRTGLGAVAAVRRFNHVNMIRQPPAGYLSNE